MEEETNIPQTSQNPSDSDEVTQVLASLFTKHGLLSPPRYFQKLGYNWKISAEFSNLHNVPSVDLKVECLDLDDKFLSMMVIFKNNTHIEKHSFWHVFDKNRCSFCYRRVATGVRTVRSDGVTVVNFPIDRFMKDTEMGEIYDSDVQKCWPIYVPVTWNVRNNGRIKTGSVKKCYFFFDYSITLRHIVTLTTIPNRFHLPAWPKCNRFPVNLEFFQPIWPNLADFLENMHEEEQMSSERCWEICDVLGVLYHQWKFDEPRLLELENIAYKLGMLRFFEGMGLDVDYFGSSSSSQIVKDTRLKDLRNEKENVDHKVIWTLRRIPALQDPSGPCVLKVWKAGFQFTINFFKSTFRDEEYLSIGIVLSGLEDSHLTYHCTVEVEFDLPEEAPTIRTTASRQITSQENTIQIPIVCRISEISLEVKCEINFHLESSKILEDHIEMPGKNDVILKFQNKSVAVNKTYLGHHVNFFRTMFFNENFEEHKKNVLEISSVSFQEMLCFLDALYHTNKIFKVSEYYGVLRMADEWICDKVISVVENALLNCEIPSVNRKKLAKKFNLSKLMETFTEGPEKKKRRVE